MSTDESPKLPHVVIVGAGFGGLHVAQQLAKAPCRVTIVDKRNFTLFQPLLYQVATGSLSPGDIATPIRALLANQKNTRVLASTAIGVDANNQILQLEHGELHYDFLVAATGVKHSYFGNDQWADDAPGIKTVEHALEMRRQLFQAFELAEMESDEEKRRALLTFVIVGGGPTGVELAGTIAELAKKTLRRDFSTYDSATARVVLAEGADAVLPVYPEKLRRKGLEQLNNIGVEVRCNTLVTDIAPDHVVLKCGDESTVLHARTVLWAAGVQPSRFGALLQKATGASLDRGGRLRVNQQMALPTHPNIFVIGDLAHYEQDGKPLAGVAPVAKQQGNHVGESLRRTMQGKPLKTFRYRDLGSMAVIGQNHAVALIGNTKLSGFPAWFLWAFLHIAFLARTTQRMSVMLRWFVMYFFRRRGMRLVTGNFADGIGDGITPLSKTSVADNADTTPTATDTGTADR